MSALTSITSNSCGGPISMAGHRGHYIDGDQQYSRWHYINGIFDEIQWQVRFVLTYLDGAVLLVTIWLNVSNSEQAKFIGRIRIWRRCFGCRRHFMLRSTDWYWLHPKDDTTPDASQSSDSVFGLSVYPRNKCHQFDHLGFLVNAVIDRWRMYQWEWCINRNSTDDLRWKMEILTEIDEIFRSIAVELLMRIYDWSNGECILKNMDHRWCLK